MRLCKGDEEYSLLWRKFPVPIRQEKYLYIYVDSLRTSSWRSEAKGSINSSGQFAIGCPGPDRHDIQAHSGPTPGIFSPHDIAKHPVSSFVAESSGARGNQDGFIRLCGGLKTGSTSAADWIAEIKRIWAWGPASTLELARTVAAAKNPARHGQWQEIWKALPFSRRKADMLAAIGARLGWVNWQTFANLPVGWSILYHLARLDRTTLERLVQEGVIHPALKLWQAKNLVAQFNGEPNVVRAKRFNVQQRLQKFGEFVDTTSNDWSPRERRWARTRLQEILHRIAVVQNLLEPLPAGRSNVSEWSRSSAIETNSLNAQRSTQ